MSTRCDIAFVLGIVLLGLSAGPAVLLSQAAAKPLNENADLVLWVFAPWADSMDAISDAGWSPVGPIQARVGVLATPTEHAHMNVEGALVAITNPRLIALCQS